MQLSRKEDLFANKRCVKTSELFDCQIEWLKPYFEATTYPWELLPKIKEILAELLKNPPKGYTFYSDDVLIGENVKIAPTATIKGPAIIGSDTEIRPGAFFRGQIIIGPRSVIGNSSELKNCLLLEHVQVPHYNYVGDSILGNNSHMGAGSICSNLKSDGKNIVIHGEKDYETGLRKIGGILGDKADIGCGSVLNPGTVVGKNTQMYPLTMARGVYPENSIVKGTKVWVDKR